MGTETTLIPSLREMALGYVLRCYDIKASELIAHRRAQHLVEARALFTWIVKANRPRVSYPTLGRWLDRDHSTVIALHRKAILLRLTDGRFKQWCDEFAQFYRQRQIAAREIMLDPEFDTVVETIRELSAQAGEIAYDFADSEAHGIAGLCDDLREALDIFDYCAQEDFRHYLDGGDQ